MKRLFALLLAMTLVLSACGNKETAEETKVEETEKKEDTEATDSSEGGKITILVPGYDSGYLKDELDPSIEKYEKEHPGREVEILPVGWDELNEKVVQYYQAGEAPDIMIIGSRWLRQFEAMDILEPLQDFITPEFEEARIENVFDTGKVDGVQFGIPMAFSSRALFYRSDLIDTPPTNWDELYETANRLVEEGEVKYGFAFPTDQSSGASELLNFIYQGGGNVVDEEGNVSLNTPENIATLEYMTKFKEIIPDPVSTARTDQIELFVNGDLAMFVSGAWELPMADEHADETPYGITVLPEGEKNTANVMTDSYVMSSISENKELAWDFIEFMGDIEQQKVITSSRNWFPILKAEEDLDVYKEDHMQPFMEIIPFGTPQSQLPNWDEFNETFRIAIQKALSGESTPEEALNEAQKELAP